MDKVDSPRVLVTRPAHQAGPLIELIERRGGCAVRFPTLEIVAATDSDDARYRLQQLRHYDVLIFVSANAVNFALQAIDGKISIFDRHPIAAVGKATATALEAAGVKVTWLPSTGYDSEALLALPALQTVAGLSCLIVRGEGGREHLAETLRARGASVDYWEVYKRVKPVCDRAPIVDLLADEKLDVITVTSGESLVNLMEMTGPECRSQLLEVPLVVISERVKLMAQSIGFKTIFVADRPADAAILEKIQQCINGENSGRSE